MTSTKIKSVSHTIWYVCSAKDNTRSISLDSVAQKVTMRLSAHLCICKGDCIFKCDFPRPISVCIYVNGINPKVIEIRFRLLFFVCDIESLWCVCIVLYKEDVFSFGYILVFAVGCLLISGSFHMQS